VLNATCIRLLLAALLGWLDQRERQAVAYLIEENVILRSHGRGRLRLTDEERRRVARHGHRLGRRRLSEVTTIVTSDTILRVASATDRAEMDVPQATWRSFRRVS
jgi:hypothetical protein